MGQLIVVTDCAVYTYLADPIPISEICRYLVYLEDAKSAVTLSAPTANRNIFGGTFVAKNTAGMELVQLIKALQKQLMQNYPWARQQRDSLAKGIMAEARKQMRSGRISTEKWFQLDLIAEEAAYTDEVILLKAEDVFRTCSQIDFQNFVSQQESRLSQAARTALLSSVGKFSEALIRDLADTQIDFGNEYLETAYHSMSELTSYTNEQCLILTHLCARMGKEEQFEKLRDQVGRRCGESKAYNVDLFRCSYCNGRMKNVYDTIRRGCMPPVEQLDWVDSIGLSVLHYAILLRQEQLVEELLEKKSWAIKLPFSDGEAELLYDYTVLACYKNLSNRRSVFQKTSKVVAAQSRSRKALERRLWLKQRKLDIQNASIQKAKELIRTARKNGLHDKVDEYNAKLESALLLRDETRVEIDEIKQSISEIDYEINILTNDAMVDAVDVIQRLQSSMNPFAKYLFQIFSDAKLHFHVISSQQGNFCLYDYNGFHFAVPSDVHVDLPYAGDKTHERTDDSKRQESRQGKYQQNRQKKTSGDHQTHERQDKGGRQESKEEPIVKPYGTSWFSPEAHRDMKKLKEEYRSLAKKYHPDVSDHPRSKEAFQDILNERADILERMSDR